jgi:hypothetical protein
MQKVLKSGQDASIIAEGSWDVLQLCDLRTNITNADRPLLSSCKVTGNDCQKLIPDTKLGLTSKFIIPRLLRWGSSHTYPKTGSDVSRSRR